MFEWELSIINGIKVGIEHLTVEEDSDLEMEWAIMIDLFIFRIGLFKY